MATKESETIRLHSTTKQETFKNGSHSKDLNKVNALKTKPDEFKIVARINKVDNGEGVKFQGLDEESVWSSESEEEKLPAIPDGGWGWVVVLAAFLVSACADGLCFSFGLLHEEFTIYFQSVQSETALIGSFFMAIPLLAGPIMSAFVDRFGCRSMTIAAGILSTVGFLLAAISNSIPMLCLTFGVLTGLGMGILYVTAVVSVAFWFDKRRNLAVSLASCGIGFGTVFYSPLTNYLLQIYDWRNTVVILAGTLLNMCVCGALMRDPDWLTVKNKRERSLSRSRVSSSAASISSRSVSGDSVFLTSEELKSLVKSGKSPEHILATLVTTIAEAEQLDATTKLNSEQTYKRMHSVVHLPTYLQQNEKVPPEVIEKLMTNKKLYNIILENYPSLLKMRSNSEMQLNIDSELNPKPERATIKIKISNPKFTKKTNFGIESFNENEEENELEADNKLQINNYINTTNNMNQNINNKYETEREVKSNNYITKKNLRRKSVDWFKRGIWSNNHYLRAMPLHRNSIVYRGAMMNIPKYKLRASSLPNIYKNSTWSLGTTSDEESAWYETLWNVTKKTFDFKMFTEFHFLMFNLGSLILSMWLIVPYFFLKSYMTDRNIDGAPTMISIIGVTSSIGIVVLGWAGDQPWVNVTKTYAVCLMICGLSVALYPPFITNFWVSAVISGAFGLSFASSYSYTPAILMELMPLDSFTVAYGMILLSHGMGELVGPSIGGMLFDISGTWDLTFYVGGAWLVVSGVCIGVISYTNNVRLYGTAPLLKDEADKTSKNITEDGLHMHIHV